MIFFLPVIFIIILVPIAFFIVKANSDKYYFFDNFEDNEVGDFPDGWSSRFKGISIVEDNGNKLVELHDKRATAPVEFAKYFPELQHGKISFQIMGKTYKSFSVHLCSGKGETYNHIDDIILYFSRFSRGLGIWLRTGNTYVKLENFHKNTFYTIEIIFDIKSEFSIRINEKIIGNFQYHVKPNEFNNLYFETKEEDSNFKIYIDNVEISEL